MIVTNKKLQRNLNLICQRQWLKFFSGVKKEMNVFINIKNSNWFYIMFENLILLFFIIYARY